MFENLEQLIKTIRERKNSSPDKSYTNKLLNDKNLSVSKVKEEIGELIESVEKNSNKIHEAADVVYHLMVYLEANDIKIEDVMSELKKRTLEMLDLVGLTEAADVMYHLMVYLEANNIKIEDVMNELKKRQK